MGVTFTIMRACEFASLITVIGLCANFMNQIAATEREAPAELVGTLTVEVTAVIYVMITCILYYDNMLPLVVAGVLDGALLIASVVVAALVGKPLAALDCSALPSPVPAIATFFSSSPSAHPIRATGIVQSLPYPTFVALDQPTCYEIKAVWGLSIAQCVLFAFSGLGRAGANGGSPKDAKQEEPWNRAPKATAPHSSPPPPVAPIRHCGYGRSRDRQPRPATPPRPSCDSDDSTYVQDCDVNSSPQPRGLRPPPPIRTQQLRTRPSPSSTPGDGQPRHSDNGKNEDDGISPVLSRAPPPPPPATLKQSPPRLRIPTADPATASSSSPSTTASTSPTSAADDVIPDEHKRIPRSPRSPRSPLLALGLGLGGLLACRGKAPARRGQEEEDDDEEEEEEVLWVRRRKRRARAGGPAPVTPPIVIVRPPPAAPRPPPSGSPGPDGDGGSGCALCVPGERRKRRTVWGMIDGWWDLGLLERMGTVRRKK
ncbi:hypothetical protein VTH06DRAFT_5341 [Thermothelomyces fergusii]